MDVLATTGGDGVVVTRWIPWQRVFSVGDVGAGNAAKGAGGAPLTSLKWSVDGAILAALSSDGTLSVVAAAQEASFLSVSAPRGGGGGTKSQPRSGALAWAAVTARTLPHAIPLGGADGYAHTALSVAASPEASDAAALLEWLHAPESLPRAGEEDTGTSFAAWDADQLAAAGCARADARVTCADVAFSMDDGRAAGRKTRNSSDGAGSSLARVVGAVAAAAAALARGGGAKEVTGLPGASSDPRALLGSAALPASISALAVPGGAGLRVLLGGTTPLWTAALPPDVNVAAVSLSPDVRAVAVMATSHLSHLSIFLSALADDKGVPLDADAALAHAAAALPLADACIRATTRATTIAAKEWRAAQSVLLTAAQALQTALALAAPSRAASARAARIAARAFPRSPAPGATAEVWRAGVIGASAGGALTAWLESGGGGSVGGDTGLARLARGVEAALASLESLVVLRAAPALDILTVLSAGLLAGARGPRAAAYATLGLTGAALSVLAESVSVVGERLSGLRGAAAAARASYAAFFAHLRLLRLALSGDAATAATEAVAAGRAHPPATALADSDAHLVAAALAPEVADGGASREARGFADAADGPYDADADVDEDVYADYANESDADSADERDDGNDANANGNASTANNSPNLFRATKAAADPLGLGFLDSPGTTADPLGLGFSSSPPASPSHSLLTELDSPPLDDIFLPFSLSALLGSQTQVSFLAQTAERPMADYCMVGGAKTEEIGAGKGSGACVSVAASVAALAEAWERVAASPNAALSDPATTVSLATIRYSTPAAAAAAARASCLFFDDRDLPGCSGSAAHVAFIALPGSECDGVAQTARVLLLRVDAGQHIVGVALELPPGASLLAAVPYAPPAGAVAAARAAPGGGTARAPRLTSDTTRAVAALVWAPQSSSPSDIMGLELWLCMVREGMMAPVPVAAADVSVWATTSTRGGVCKKLIDISPRRRLLAVAPRAVWLQDGNITVDALASTVALDAAGPRGVAIVTAGAPVRRTFVVDMEEDEEEEEEEEGGGMGGEDNTGEADMETG